MDFSLVLKKNIPNHCNTSLKKKGKKCSNCNTYMFVLSTGEQLFSCGIQKHIDNIVGLVSSKRSIAVFQKKKYYLDQRLQKYSQKYTIDKTEDDTKKDLTRNIFHTFETCQLINYCFDEISEIKREIDNETDIIKLQKLHEKLDDSNAVYVRYNILVKLNLEFNGIYTDLFIVYKFPFSNCNTCTICFDKTSIHDSGNLPCGHGFHNECITSWFKKALSSPKWNLKSCPNCRANLNVSMHRYTKRIR